LVVKTENAESKIMTGRDHLGNLDINERIILKWILKEIGCKSVNWIQFAQDRVLWQVFISTIMNLQIP
jgi:hypothetical protein